MSASLSVSQPVAPERRPGPVLVPEHLSPFAEDVRAGLGATPKTMSPAWFYDERGSALFEEITRLPEYYLTRAEREIFVAHADEIVTAASAGSRLSILELGAGTAEKTGILLAAAVDAQGDLVYQPVDVSATALDAAVASLSSSLPQVRIQPVVADYTDGYENLPRPHGRRLALYIGSSIGNFSPGQAQHVLRELRSHLLPGDSLLLGTDLRKDTRVLLPAYDDRAGVTAAFNRNLLVRMNRELGANFDLDGFAHEARWNAVDSRVEMHLVSLRAQRVSIPAAHLEVCFAAGESIHTENSYKFSTESVAALLQSSGYSATRQWQDSEGRFAVTLATV